MLSNADHYLNSCLLGELTIGCGDWTKAKESSIELDNWLNFIRIVINRYGSHLASLQITNEPNLSFMEGSKPYIMQALVEGVITAKKETREHNLPIKIGFGSVPESPASVSHFWEDLSKTGNKAFTDSIDFVGHNFYVDVFEDQLLDIKEISVSVERILRDLRERNLVTAGIPSSVPIRVTENGWPTGKNPVSNIDRSYERQVQVLEIVIRTIYHLRQELNISHYELFGLRDADSSKDDLFHQYGIMRDDYSPKPAYGAFKRLIRELGI
jgi:beta-glucosidase/6-phospho-beta-glucosidase/beta-galactosidase